MRAGKAAGYAVEAMVGPDAALGVVYRMGGCVLHAVGAKAFEPGRRDVGPGMIDLEQLRLARREPAAQDGRVYASGFIAYPLQMTDRIVDRHHVIERNPAGVQVAVAASKGFVRKDRSDLFARPLFEFVNGLEIDGFQRNSVEHNGSPRVLFSILYFAPQRRCSAVVLAFGRYIEDASPSIPYCRQVPRRQ